MQTGKADVRIQSRFPGCPRRKLRLHITSALPLSTDFPPPLAQPSVTSSFVAQQRQAGLIASFPQLQAPSLTVPSSTGLAELVAANADGPHWGTRLAQQAVAAATQRLALGGQPGALSEVQSALQSAQSLLDGALGQLAGIQDHSGLSNMELPDMQQTFAQVQQLAAAAEQASTAALQELLGLSDASGRQQLVSQGQQLLRTEYAGYSLQTLLLLTAGVAALIALVTPSKDEGGPPGGSGGRGRQAERGGRGLSARSGTDMLPATWDPDLVAQYYARRPVSVAQRVLEVAREACAVGTALAADVVADTVEQNQALRARQVVAAVERLGPAFVKVAQALSTRTDILPMAYLLELQSLQDRVPSFPDDVAYACIEEAFGQPVGQAFSRLSPTSVAAASLGQVYRGTLRSSGQEVAIKVRRPGVLESVTLDLLLMRHVAAAITGRPEVKSDWVAIIDTWASRFLNEIDYTLEAANARRLASDLASLPGILIPAVVDEGSTRSVLVTEWVQGERLSESSAADVRQLCDTLLSAYLIQLLETGLLHADPHTGNLLRTADGRIALLDHGLVEEIPRDYSLALMEYITHLSIGDWASLADDLVKLGFTDSVADKERLVEPLGLILSELSKGGGARGVNVALVTQQIEALSEEYEFKIPPYFALILRCFSLIEGIALQSDPSYSIVKECFPALCRHLLTNNDPRAREALRQLLFAGDQSQLSLERLQRLMQGLNSFTVDGLTAAGRDRPPAAAGAAPAAAAEAAPAPLLDRTGQEVLRAVFAERPTHVQELLVEQAVNTADAASRQLAALLLSPALGGLAAIRSNGQLGGAAMPPAMALLSRLPALVEVSPADQQQLQTAHSIAQLLAQQRPQDAALRRQQARQLVREVAPLLPELLPGISATGRLFARQLARRTFDRLASLRQDSALSALD